MSFQCPVCQSVSHHPDDERHGYCGKCHAFTASPPGNVRYFRQRQDEKPVEETTTDPDSGERIR